MIIQDGVEVAWSSLLDVDSYSIRILQKDMDRIPEILKAVPQDKIQQMQANIAKVWRRCAAAAAVSGVGAGPLGWDSACPAWSPSLRNTGRGDSQHRC